MMASLPEGGALMTERRRSQLITDGDERAPNRAMLRAVGFSDADFGKPVVGVANAYSNLAPCNLGLNTLAERGEAAVRAAGAMPQVFGTITVSDAISMGTEGMKYSLVSREVIADSIETVCNAQAMDGVLAIGGAAQKKPRGPFAPAGLGLSPGVLPRGAAEPRPPPRGGPQHGHVVARGGGAAGGGGG